MNSTSSKKISFHNENNDKYVNEFKLDNYKSNKN